MPLEIRVPMMGESVVEATVGKWFKREGERVAAGEPVVELETDKVNLEVAAEQAGVLARIDRQTGETVQIGDVLGSIEPVSAPEGAQAAQGTGPSAEASAGAARPKSEGRPAATPAAGQVAAAPSAAQDGKPAQAEPVPATSPSTPPATPVARRVAEEQGVDISRVPGSGPRGSVTKEDVLRYAAQPAATPPAPAPVAPAPVTPTTPAAPAAPAGAAPLTERREERVRMTRRRQTIAQRLLQAQQNAALLTTFNEIDMSAVMDLRQRRKEAFKERHGVGLGFMSFFTRATVGALKAFPLLNAEIQGDEIVIKHYYDIGVAVSTEGGLVVPVLRDADRLSFAAIERGIGDLATRARAGTLTLEDLRGGTFSITNGGVFGSLLSTPILNPPQVGILGMHKIQERPIALGGQVVIRPMMYVALTYDHRIVDGQQAVQFLVKVKELVEDPEALLLEG